MLGKGAGPDRSASHSPLFHACRLPRSAWTVGWLGTVMAQFHAKGFRPDIMRRWL
jgi:cytochrome o ubiquinol oxidase subunit 1